MLEITLEEYIKNTSSVTEINEILKHYPDGNVYRIVLNNISHLTDVSKLFDDCNIFIDLELIDNLKIKLHEDVKGIETMFNNSKIFVNKYFYSGLMSYSPEAKRKIYLICDNRDDIYYTLDKERYSSIFIDAYLNFRMLERR